MFKIKKFLRSFRYAGNGILLVIRGEQNFVVHIFAAVLAIALALFFRMTLLECVLVLVLIAMVFVAEIINTVVEKILDVLHPDQHPAIKNAKDMMAGVVLIVALVAFIIGVALYGPYLWRFLMGLN